MKFDLEDRTLNFAKNSLDFYRILDKNLVNVELIRQSLRASCSVGANYREANDTITKKDFLHKVGICRREAKEAKYWFELILHANPGTAKELEPLIDEAWQLAKIFSSISRGKKKE